MSGGSDQRREREFSTRSSIGCAYCPLFRTNRERACPERLRANKEESKGADTELQNAKAFSPEAFTSSLMSVIA